MKRRTHVLSAVLVTAPLAVRLGFNGFCAVLAVVASALGSVVPDTDLRRGHRVRMHNLAALAATASPIGVLYAVTGWEPLLAVLAGYAVGYGLHILYDSFTAAGTAPLYPFARRRLRLARMRSDSMAANALALLISLAAAAAIYTAPASLPPLCTP